LQADLKRIEGHFKKFKDITNPDKPKTQVDKKASKRVIAGALAEEPISKKKHTNK
jgi:hypothetical protein